MERTPRPLTIAPARIVRAIIISDAAAEGDDAFAIAHALLSPRLCVKFIAGCHYGARTEGEAGKSLERIKALLHIMNDGTEAMLGSDFPGDISSEATSAIISEAMKEDPRPLYVISLGPLTDLYAAYIRKPEIAKRLTAIWVGGDRYPDGGREFNALNDIEAANGVLLSDIPLYQITREAYIELGVSFAELDEKMKGSIGRFLLKQLHDYADSKTGWSDLRSGETWTLGDNSAISVLLYKNPYHFSYESPRPINPDGTYGEAEDTQRRIRVYHHVDSRLTLEDFFAKLKAMENDRHFIS